MEQISEGKARTMSKEEDWNDEVVKPITAKGTDGGNDIYVNEDSGVKEAHIKVILFKDGTGFGYISHTSDYSEQELVDLIDEEVEALFNQLANQDYKDYEEDTLRRLYNVFSDMLEDMLEAI